MCTVHRRDCARFASFEMLKVCQAKLEKTQQHQLIFHEYKSLRHWIFIFIFMESNLSVLPLLQTLKHVSFERKLAIVEEMDALILSLLLDGASRVKISSKIKDSLQCLPEFLTCSNHIRKLQNWRTFILKVHSGERSKDGKRGRSVKHNYNKIIIPLLINYYVVFSSVASIN